MKIKHIPRRTLLIVICSSFVLICAVASTINYSKAPSRLKITQVNKPPKHLKYWALFRHLVILDKKADDAEKKRNDGSKYRQHYRSIAQLTDQEEQSLKQIATNCFEKVTRQDEKAWKLISEIRAKYPGGKIENGQELPSPPPELVMMQKERDNIIIESQNKLRQAFGEAAFTRFDTFVDEKIGSHGEMLGPDPTRRPRRTPVRRH